VIVLSKNLRNLDIPIDIGYIRNYLKGFKSTI